MLISIAHAIGSTEAQTSSPNDIFMQFIPLIAMLAIFYFLLIRPQQKRTKQHKSMLEALKKGDVILNTGGLIGTITEIDGDTITLDLGSTNVKINRAYVVGLVDSKTNNKK